MEAMYMIYCVADIHGEYQRYLALLDKLQLQGEDTLYVLGDVVDRGAEGMKVLLDMMGRPNVVPLLGNHEYMAAVNLRFLMQEVTRDSLEDLDADDMQNLLEWQEEGGTPTIEGFQRLSPAQRQAVLDYLGEFELYEEVEVNGQEYLLVHAGPRSYGLNQPLEDFGLHDLIWSRLDYSRPYFSDRIMVTGHTPTRLISENPRPDYIFKGNGHIAIDCGAVYGGQLGAVCLETGEEFYVK
jgi:serine/threonine protein phosphatase 1